MSHVIVIGGGVIGVSSAYYLARAGWRVTIIDRERMGRACSHANCGLVAVSHVLPLAEPGAIGKTLKGMLQKNSPFYVKPRLDPALWRWMLRFAKRCNHRDMLAAAHARHRLLQSSLALYQDIIADGIQCEWEERGCLFVYRTTAAWDKYAKTNELLSKSFDLPARRLDAEQLGQFESALREGLAGGWYYPVDTHLRPDRLMSSWVEKLGQLGVTVIEQCDASRIHREGRAAIRIATPHGDMDADALVVATGALTPALSRELGCPIPIQPGKGYSITMPRPDPCPGVPLIFPEHKVVVTPMQSGYRLGSTMEFSGFDSTINERRLDALKRAAAAYLRVPHAEPVEERWFGWRPMTYDGIPLIGRCPRWDNVYVAAGHNMLGLSMAPATGKLIAEMVEGHEPHLPAEPYAVGRFRHRSPS